MHLSPTTSGKVGRAICGPKMSESFGIDKGCVRTSRNDFRRRGSEEISLKIALIAVVINLLSLRVFSIAKVCLHGKNKLLLYYIENIV